MWDRIYFKKLKIVIGIEPLHFQKFMPHYFALGDTNKDGPHRLRRVSKYFRYIRLTPVHNQGKETLCFSTLRQSMRV